MITIIWINSNSHSVSGHLTYARKYVANLVFCHLLTWHSSNIASQTASYMRGPITPLPKSPTLIINYYTTIKSIRQDSMAQLVSYAHTNPRLYGKYMPDADSNRPPGRYFFTSTFRLFKSRDVFFNLRWQNMFLWSLLFESTTIRTASVAIWRTQGNMSQICFFVIYWPGTLVISRVKRLVICEGQLPHSQSHPP